jgi:hypothetical protein
MDKPEPCDLLNQLFNKPGGDRVHVCVMGLKWGNMGVVHVTSLPYGFGEKKHLAKKS